MRRTLTSAVALLAVAGLAASVPADAAKKKPKPIKKTFAMELLPVPDPPSGTSCTRVELENVAMHTEEVAAKGGGRLDAKVTGFTGDWDITVFDKSDGTVLAVGGGTTTGGGAPAQNATDTVTVKVKRATTFLVRYCNFAGTPQATGSYTFTYK